MWPRGAERHANADFLSSLRYGVRQHTINSYCSKQQRQAGKDSYQQSNELFSCSIVGNHTIHGADIVEGETGIEAGQFVAHGLCDSSDGGGGVQHEEEEVVAVKSRVTFWLRRLGQAPLLDVADHANHLL